MTSAYSVCEDRGEVHESITPEYFVMSSKYACPLLQWKIVSLIYWTISRPALWKATLSLSSKAVNKPATWEIWSLYPKGFAIQTFLKRYFRRDIRALSPRSVDMWERPIENGLQIESSIWIAYILCFDYCLPH